MKILSVALGYNNILIQLSTLVDINVLFLFLSSLKDLGDVFKYTIIHFTNRNKAFPTI